MDQPDHRERRFGAPDGLCLFASDYGDPLSTGRPMLCLSGLARNSMDFRDLARRLSAGRRVVCPDYRGRGRSDYDPDWRNYRPEVYLRDVSALIAATNLHGMVVCGTSMGGLLAMGLAVAAPIGIAGLILNDIGPRVGRQGFEKIRRYLGQDPALPDWDAAVVRLKELFPDLGLGPEARWRRFAEATYREDDDGRLHVNWDVNIARSLGGRIPDLWALFGAVRRLPVLAIRGERSEILTAGTFGQMLAAKPDLLQITVPGVGHAPTLDEPEARKAIDDFLARIDRDRPGPPRH